MLRLIRRFDEILNKFAKRRSFHLISMEWERVNGQLQRHKPVPIEVVSFVDGKSKRETLARLDNRGGCEWLEWLKA